LKKFWQNKFVRDVEPMIPQCGNTRRDLETLKAALRFAYEKSWIESVPRISLPPKGQPRDRFLSTEEARLLVECSASAHLKLAILIMLGTGCRVGASLDLTWDRVDFERDIIDFHNPEKMVTKKRRAVVPMSGTLKAALTDAQQWATCGNVIEWKGKPVQTIKGSFRKAATRAGIPFCTPHTLKHTAISWMAEKFSVDQISDYTQTTPETVRRVYRKVNSSSLAPMADFLGDALRHDVVRTPKGGKLLSP
jgi:integrase